MRDLYSGVYPAIMDLTFHIVDVRDVAKTQLAAARIPEASGRYIACAGGMKVRDIVSHARTVHDHKKLPKLRLDHPVGNSVMKLLAYAQPKGVRQYLHDNLGKRSDYDTSRVPQELGIEYHSLKETITDTIRDQIVRGHISE
jgi:dihydroflavonol-4-reductase